MSPYRVSSPPVEVPEKQWTPRVGDMVICTNRREEMRRDHIGRMGEICDVLGKILVVVFRDGWPVTYALLAKSEIVKVEGGSSC